MSRKYVLTVFRLVVWFFVGISAMLVIAGLFCAIDVYSNSKSEFTVYPDVIGLLFMALLSACGAGVTLVAKSITLKAVFPD
jgi:hypothetical protein